MGMEQNKHQIIITPGLSNTNYWRDLYRYRELFFMLSWRDLKVRYKQTVIGILWGIFRPLLTMAILTFVFGRIANLQAGSDKPYSLLVLAGLVPWQFFANATGESSNSLVDNQNLITKVYFPRIIIPLGSTITSFVDFLIALGLYLLLMIMYGVPPTWHILLLPFFTVLIFLLSFGIGTLLTAFNVKYRDFRYVLPFIIQIGLYISPIGYSTDAVPQKLGWLYSLNPMVGIIDGFRWCLLGETPQDWWSIATSLALSLMMLAIGVSYFRKTEKKFADII